MAQHQADHVGPDDGADAAYAEPRAHAGGAQVRRIVGRRECIQAGLGSGYAGSGRENESEQ